MKIKKRYIIGYLIFLVIAGCVAYGVWKLVSLNPNRRRQDIINWVESRYNVKLSLGLILPIIYPGIGLEMEDVLIELPDPARVRPELLRAKGLKAVIDLKALVEKRRLLVRDLILIEPEVYYEWSPAERARFHDLKKPKTAAQIAEEAEPENILGKRIIAKAWKWFKIEFRPEDLLDTQRVLISDGKLNIYDRRDRPNPIPPITFGNVDIGLTASSQKNSFIFWMETPFPYSENGPAGLALKGKGRMEVSFNPFKMSITTSEGTWGTYPIKHFDFNLNRGEERFLWSGVVESSADLNQLSLLASWPPLEKLKNLLRYQPEGQAEYRVRFQSGNSVWDKLSIEEIKLDNFGAVLIDPKQQKTKLVEPLLFKKARVVVEDLNINKPVTMHLELLFPYQEPLRKLTPYPLVVDGTIQFDQKFSAISFRADKASFGNNRFSQFDLDIDRSKKPAAIKGSLVMQGNDLSQLTELLDWRIFKIPRNVSYMNLTGKGKINVDFRYPQVAADGSNKIWYQATTKLTNAHYDPGAVIAPVDQFSGDISIAPEKISMPVYWLRMNDMPLQSDLTFTNLPGQNPRLDFHTTAADIDLGKVFIHRNRPPDPSILPGSTLGPMRTVYAGDVISSKMRYRKIVCDDVRGRWKHKDRVLGFYEVTLKYHKGWYQDNGTWVDFRRANMITFHWNGHFENFALRRMFDELFGYDFFVDGKATGQGYLTGTYINNSLDFKSLNGYFKAQVTDGNLIGYNLGIRILQFLGFKIDPKKYGLPFDTGKAELSIRDGVIYFDDLTLRSWNLEAHCSGQVDLSRQKLKLWVAAYPLKALSTVTKPIPFLGALINQTQETLFGYYAKAEGPWKDIAIAGYFPLTEKIQAAPPPPEFPARPWQ